MAKELPIDARIVEQLAKATVKSLFDGIVELVTNSDDSYKRLEGQGKQVSGKIEIYVDREKGGICKNLRVKDWAEGMSKDKLEQAIVFGGETSGFEKGKSVRGLFGRGLKETIIALGEGEITTNKYGKISKTRLWFDRKLKKPQYDDELLNKSRTTTEANYTEINIKITNKKIKIPDYETFKKRLSSHYALRDINSANNREIKLIFEDLKRKSKNTVIISFTPPEGEKVLEKEIIIPKFRDKIKITIYESSKPLTSPRHNPYGLAGVLIKTRSAILDNQLFKFENETAALYFYGQAICNGMEERLRNGETEIIDPNRGGIEWNYNYCSTLAESIENVLQPLVLKKQREIEKIPEVKVKEPTKKMLKKLRSLLNEIAKGELEEMPGVPADPEPDITRLLIKPERANIALNEPRTFSIYAPKDIVESEGVEAYIDSDNYSIQPLSTVVKLEKHRKFPNRIWYKYFKVVGTEENAESTITVYLGKEIASAIVKVAFPKKKKKGKVTGRKGGFISEFIADELNNPMQRVVYRNGVIRVYVNFPSVSKFIKSGFQGVETREGRLLLAELVGEALCKELARRGIENNKYPAIQGGEIDAFNTAVNELQKKYLYRIQNIIFAWKF